MHYELTVLVQSWVSVKLITVVIPNIGTQRGVKPRVRLDESLIGQVLASWPSCYRPRFRVSLSHATTS